MRKIENYTKDGVVVPNKWGSKKFEHKNKTLEEGIDIVVSVACDIRATLENMEIS